MKRSKHSLSHYRLTSLNQGQLFPVMCEEVLPGDSWRHQSAALIRVSPLVAPVMHHVACYLHSWFVPWRLLWSNWEDFITGKNTALTLPTMTFTPSTDAGTKALAQTLGIGVSGSTPVTVQSLPFRAYNMIWNEFYRDQDLHTKLNERSGDTGDLPADYAIQKVSWEKDYFTAARPTPQQGTDGEVVPLSFNATTAPVLGIGKITAVNTHNNTVVRESDGTTTTYPTSTLIGDTPADNQFHVQGVGSPAFPNIYADLAAATAGTMKIEDWRRAMAMQKIREHRNKYGSRYRDMLAFLGVRSSDARLQRPEYLGGGKNSLSFSEVLSTADTGTAEVGALAGHGIASLRTRPYRRFFEEHGVVMTFLFLRPRTVYVNNVKRMFLRRKYNEFWQKELEMIGQQTITNFEIYGDSATPSSVFGYIPRYDEYRHAESSVTGEFRSVLDYWHMGRIFQTQPALNGAFITADPTTRIYASAATDQLYAMVSHRISARRLVAKFART